MSDVDKPWENHQCHWCGQSCNLDAIRMTRKLSNQYLHDQLGAVKIGGFTHEEIIEIVAKGLHAYRERFLKETFGAGHLHLRDDDRMIGVDFHHDPVVDRYRNDPIFHAHVTMIVAHITESIRRALEADQEIMNPTRPATTPKVPTGALLGVPRTPASKK